MSSETTSALDRFAARIPPRMVDVIRSWRGDDGFGRLAAAIEGATTFTRFLDVYAEAVLAQHLRERGAACVLEVPTPSGRTSDFQVTLDGRTVFLHLKRINTERPSRRLTISSRLRGLERIRRPYIVKVRWTPEATDDDMQLFVHEARAFIQHARVGDEHTVHNAHGDEIGGVLILAPWAGSHVTLTIGLPDGFIDTAPRIAKLMRRAHRQFMPKAANAVIICSSDPGDLESFDTALLGAHEERWDAFPPHGRRIAHGRAEDGLWYGERYADWRAAGFFAIALADTPLDLTLRLRREPAPDDAMVRLLERLFRPA